MEWWRGYRMTYGEVENLPLSFFIGVSKCYFV